MLAQRLNAEVFADVPHRQCVFTIPRRLRVYFLYDRSLLGKLCRAAYETLRQVVALELRDDEAVPAMVAAPQTFGDLIDPWQCTPLTLSSASWVDVGFELFSGCTRDVYPVSLCCLACRNGSFRDEAAYLVHRGVEVSSQSVNCYFAFSAAGRWYPVVPPEVADAYPSEVFTLWGREPFLVENTCYVCITVVDGQRSDAI
jgi:hypothetical protein